MKLCKLTFYDDSMQLHFVFMYASIFNPYHRLATYELMIIQVSIRLQWSSLFFMDSK